jgi:hypothetical protein
MALNCGVNACVLFLGVQRVIRWTFSTGLILVVIEGSASALGDYQKRARTTIVDGNAHHKAKEHLIYTVIDRPLSDGHCHAAMSDSLPVWKKEEEGGVLDDALEWVRALGWGVEDVVSEALGALVEERRHVHVDTEGTDGDS